MPVLEDHGAPFGLENQTVLSSLGIEKVLTSSALREDAFLECNSAIRNEVGSQTKFTSKEIACSVAVPEEE